MKSSCKKAESSSWLTGFFSCFSDMESCCLGCWCPCILYGKNHEALTGGDSCGNCLGFFGMHCLPFGACFLPCLTLPKRKMIREAYDLPDGCCESYCVHFAWFLPCALCQEARELKLRGHSPENPLRTRAMNHQIRSHNSHGEAITEAPAVQSIGMPIAEAEEKEKEKEKTFTAPSSALNPHGRADVSFGFIDIPK